MRVIVYDRACYVLKAVGDQLEKYEVENNLPLGLLYSLANKELIDNAVYIDDARPFFAIVEDKGESVLFLMITGPKNKLIISGEGPNIEEAIKYAASYLLGANIPFAGVIGLLDIATKFAEVWAERTHSSPVIQMNQRIYKLEKVKESSRSPGILRPADINDIEVITKWIHDFWNCTGDTISQENAERKANDNIQESSLFLWEIHNKPVSMAKKARPTKNGIVVSLVYTPPENRGIGYATACVAALSELLLNSGYKFCSLYTDLSNPTSNRIYQNIGYVPIQDSVVYSFNMLESV